MGIAEQYRSSLSIEPATLVRKDAIVFVGGEVILDELVKHYALRAWVRRHRKTVFKVDDLRAAVKRRPYDRNPEPDEV